MLQARKEHLVMLQVEHGLLRWLSKQPNFYENIVKRFKEINQRRLERFSYSNSLRFKQFKKGGQVKPTPRPVCPISSFDYLSCMLGRLSLIFPKELCLNSNLFCNLSLKILIFITLLT